MRAENERSRPAGNGPARESLDNDNLSVRATTDFLTQLAACSGPDDPVFRVATLLAEAWQPALDRSYRLGLENGYCAGFYESERLTAQSWRNAVRPIKDVLAQPTRDELAARRGGRS